MQAARKNIELKQKLSHLTPDTIVSDYSRLQQILINLLSNAIKFTREGYIELRVRRNVNNPRQLVFEVEDTGIGIKEEDRGQLFKMFSRLRTVETRRQNTKGVGLGLTICRRLVQQCGGQIDFSSTIGVGSTFWFSIEYLNSEISQLRESTFSRTSATSFHLPIKIPESCEARAYLPDLYSDLIEEESVPESSRELRIPVDRQHNILIVDDIDFNIFTLQQLIERKGPMRCDAAYNG